MLRKIVMPLARGLKIIRARPKILMALVKALGRLAVSRAKFSVSCCWWRTISRRRKCTSTARCGFSPSACCVPARGHHYVRETLPYRSSDQKFMRVELRQDFFSDSSQWCAHRSEKVDPRYPDLKHKKTQQGLWSLENLTPPWVKAELGTGSYVSRGPISDRKMTREKLWRAFFSDPSQWWDNRSEKVNPRYPDFKNKKTQHGLWIIDNMTPPWVEAELATMAPGLLHPDSFSWNLRLRRHIKAQDYEKTLNLFRQMQQEGMIPDKFTFVPVLNACSNLRSLEEGRRVHQEIIQRGCESDIYVATCLFDMYVKCGSIEDAWNLFNRMQQRSVVSWTAMIVGYVKSEQGLKALELFREMQQEGVEPNTVTFVGALSACASVAALGEGRRVHKQIIQKGCESNVYVATCLVNMYAKCGCIEDAWTVFNKMRERDVVSWSAMIMGYVKSEQGVKALELFRKMQQEGLEPDSVTFVGALNACTSVGALEEGRYVHNQIVRRGCESDIYVATCLVDMYAKCGSIEDGWIVFNKMQERSVVSWNAMIMGYVKSEQGLKALELFRKMQQEGMEPDAFTFAGALNACVSFLALREGRRVHKQIVQRGCESDVYVANCLVDMYAKCGSTKDARTVFNKMRERTVVSWSTMIGGYAMHGQSKKAIELFDRMGKEGVEINEITFTCLLSACSHGGLVEKGLLYFNTMTSAYDVLPTREHYVCMVDLLGRAGRLIEAEEMAEELMKRMPMERDSCVWRCLLGACRIHGNIEVAERAARRCLELDPKNASAYVLLSNIDWLKKDVRKVPGCTWIQVENVVHKFVVDDEKHLENLQIQTKLDRLKCT